MRREKEELDGTRLDIRFHEMIAVRREGLLLNN
jgi:hypothetical protein